MNSACTHKHEHLIDRESIINRTRTTGLIAGSDENAFRLLFVQYRNKGYALANRHTRDKASSEDVVQEVFTKSWLN